jgi:HEAT repeat protein
VSQTQDPQVGLAATWALITLQPSAPGIEQAVPLLTAGLADEWDLVRRECATALGMLGARAVSAEAALLPLLEDPVPEVRAETLVTLHDIGSDVSRLLPRLTAGLHDPAPAVRYASAYVLGRVGPSAQSAIPQLREMLNRRNELDRTFAAWALVKISPTPRNRREATPLMVSALTHPRAAIRREAATLLGELGPRGAAARRALTRATQDDDPSVRAAAAEALEKLPPPQNPDSQTR